MRLLRYLIPATLCVFGLSYSSVHARAMGCSPDSFHNCTAQRDFEAVQEFVNSKRTIPLEEKDCNLTIAGDIRANWASILERINCEKLRGNNGNARQFQEPACGINSDGECVIIGDTGDVTDIPPYGGPNGRGIPFSTSSFDVEFNLYVDYVCDRSWGVAWVEFNDDGGVQQNPLTCEEDPQGLFGSGCFNGLCLRKAYMGYNLYVDGCSRFDIELGRRPLYTVFDSRIQFQSNFDGVLLKYAARVDGYGDFYGYGAVFVVDERANHYAWIVELGLLGACNRGFDIRYSFIDWNLINHHNHNRCDVFDPVGIQFKISQATISYTATTPCWCIPAKVYGAVLYNHCAQNPEFAHIDGRKGLGGYVGMIIGEVCGEGDWAFDFNWQYVEPYAIPDTDVSGIGRNGSNLLMQSVTSWGRGFANYKGWRFEFLYAITDNLSFDASYEFSREVDPDVRGTQGGPAGINNYSKFEVEAIYAF